VPFTRHPLDYPINRLLLKVGMALQISLFAHPPIRDRAQQQQWEKEQAAQLGLEQAIKDELIVRYFFLWDRWNGQLKTIRLVPHPRHRRVPGIPRMKELFFRRLI
jgi:hypothetical protein